MELAGAPTRRLGGVLLGAGSKPAVDVIDLDQGDHFPLAAIPDNGYPFDHGIPRVGWTVVVLGSTWAVHDGSPARVVELDIGLPAPAADPELVVGLQPDSDGRGGVALVDREGVAHRRVSCPGQPVGELTAGLVVTTRGIRRWDGGERQEFPRPLRALAVLDGRLIVLTDGQRVHTWNADSGELGVWEGAHWSLQPDSNRISTRTALTAQDGVVLVSADGAVTGHDLGFWPYCTVWIDDDHLLVSVGAHDGGRVGRARGAPPRGLASCGHER